LGAAAGLAALVSASLAGRDRQCIVERYGGPTAAVRSNRALGRLDTEASSV